MARIVGRRRINEGRGIGERLTEFLVYIALGVGLVMGLRWYFVVYRNSPAVALGSFLGAMKAGDVETQFKAISTSTKSAFPTKDAYEDKCPLARGVAGRLAKWQCDKPVESGDTATIKATLYIRKKTQELYEANADAFKDIYVLKHEAEGWRIALDASQLKSLEAASASR